MAIARPQIKIFYFERDRKHCPPLSRSDPTAQPDVNGKFITSKHFKSRIGKEMLGNIFPRKNKIKRSAVTPASTFVIFFSLKYHRKGYSINSCMVYISCRTVK